MMRLSIVLLMLTLIPGEADARRGQRVLVVRDYTSAAWGGVVEQTVEDFNAVMPQGGPQLRYQRMEPAPCMIPTRQRRAVLDVCSVPVMEHGGLAYRRPQVIVLNDTGGWQGAALSMIVCHEFMHILAHVHDNTGALPDQSCIWGELSQPGPFDVDRLREMYRRKR
jgi:hypothetical protein